MLAGRGAWIFDLDGTLTVAVHDFDAIRARLGLPAGEPILEAIARLPVAQARTVLAELDALELVLARQARPQPGARALLDGLSARGARLGILTRNSEGNARETLVAAGLADVFPEGSIMGRESCTPKPSPDGLRRLLARWGAAPYGAVIVGDYRYDLLAGREAGVATVYLDVRGAFLWREHADVCVPSLDALHALVTTRTSSP